MEAMDEPTSNRRAVFGPTFWFVVLALLAYAASYYWLSRHGPYNDGDMFLYAPWSNTGDLDKHHRLRIIFAPANLIDQAVFGGPAPVRGGTYKLE
jgi:hypothetical protein